MQMQDDPLTKAVNKFLMLRLANRWRLAQYAFACVIVAVGAIPRFVFPLDAAPYLPFMPVMFIAGFLLSRNVAWFAVILAAMSALLITLAHQNFRQPKFSDWAGYILFVLLYLTLVSVCDLMRRLLEARTEDLLLIKKAGDRAELRQAFLSSIIDHAPYPIELISPAGDLIFSNRVLPLTDVGEELKIQSPNTHAVVSHFSGREKFKQAIEKAMQGELAELQDTVEFEGKERLFDIVLTPVRQGDAPVTRLVVISKDITDQKRSEQQQRLLNYELGHRLKNTLAMIQVIGAQTFRRAENLDQAWTLFEARLRALGKAQDVLTETSWESADLKSVVENALSPHRDEKARITITGPNCYISSRCTLAMTLALHELATNAGKYGALSNEVGTVAISWEVGLSDDHQPQLVFVWQEQNGPEVSVPTRKGFGSVMIERLLLSYFNGHGGIEYQAGGVVFRLTAPSTFMTEAFKAGTVDILVLN